MNSQKRIEALDMIKCYGYVDYTILENGKMSDEIRTSNIEEIEQAVSVYGAENVYF